MMAAHQHPLPPPPPVGPPVVARRATGGPWGLLTVLGAVMVAALAVGVSIASMAPDPEPSAQQLPATTPAPPPPTTTAQASTTAQLAPPSYPPFADVDPYLSLYFITLERTTLADDQGDERLYNLGLGVCRNLDRGNGIEQELAGLVDDARLTASDAGALVGAAVADLCPHHGPTVEQYLAEQS